jgi:hypothetical protein
MSRVPIRLRLTLAFALVMALVFAAIGGFVYERVGGALLSSVDQTLRLQAADAMTHGLADRDTGGGVTLAQRLDARGQVLRTTRRGLQPLVTPAEAARAASRSLRPDAMGSSPSPRIRTPISCSARRAERKRSKRCWRQSSTARPSHWRTRKSS